MFLRMWWIDPRLSFQLDKDSWDKKIYRYDLEKREGCCVVAHETLTEPRHVAHVSQLSDS